MKLKMFVWSMVLVFVVSMLFVGVGCKTEEVAKEEAVEEVAGEKATEEVAGEKPMLEGNLTFWWWGETNVPGYEAYLEDSIAVFESMHPGVTVTQVLQSTEDTMPAFYAAASAQEGPDIATIWYGAYQNDAIYSGYVEPLNDYFSPEEMDTWNCKKMSTWRDQVWGFDLWIYASPMVYRKDLFVEAGLDPEKPPRVWDEYMDACETLRNAGIDPLVTGLKAPGWGVQEAADLYLSQMKSAEELMKMCAGLEGSFTDPEIVEFFSILEHLYKSDYFIRDVTAVTVEDGRMNFRAGQAAIASIPNQQVIEWYDDLGPDALGVIGYVSLGDEPIDWINVKPITNFITSWSPNKELAAEFLRFLHTEERTDAMLEQLQYRNIPGHNKYDPSSVQDPFKRAVHEMVLAGTAAESWGMDSVIPWSILGDGLMLMGQSLLAGDVTPEEAAQFVEDTAQTWREQNPEDVEKYIEWIEAMAK